MNQFELTAELRNDVGKGASRRLRRSGKVPGVVYGGGNDAVAVTFDHDVLLHQLDQEAFYSCKGIPINYSYYISISKGSVRKKN